MYSEAGRGRSLLEESQSRRRSIDQAGIGRPMAVYGRIHDTNGI